MRSRTTTIFSLFCLIAQVAIAQPFVDVAKIGYNLQPNFPFEDVDGELSQENYFFNINYPHQFDNGDVLIVNIEGIQIQFKDDVSLLSPENDLSSVGLRLGYRKQWNENSNTLFMFQGKAAGELDDRQSDSYQYGGILLFEQRKREDLSLKYGAYVNNEFFGLFIVPIFGLDWKINDKWYAFGSLPITGTIMRKFSNQFHMGIEYVGVVTSYRLGDEFDRRYLHYSSTDPSIRADFYLGPRNVIQFNLGRSIGRFNRLYEKDDKIGLGVSAFRFGDDRNLLNEELGDNFIFQVQYVLRFEK